MTRGLWCGSLLSVLLVGFGSSPPASAFGGRSASCAPPCPVTYVEQKVTAYKCETETKEVKVIVHEWRDVREEYKYMACEPVIVKQKVKVREPRIKEETYKYTVLEPQYVKEKVKVCELKPVTKEMEVVTYECRPVKSKEKRVVHETVCVPTTVEVVVVPRGRCGLVCCRKKDPCAPPCPQTVQCTVMRHQVVAKEVEVEVTRMQQVARTERRKVTVHEPQWVEKEVTVCKHVPVHKEGKRQVCYYETVEKEIDVHTHKLVEKTGVRVVKKCVPVEKTVKQTFTRLVPYETTAHVPVYAPCAAPCVKGIKGGCCSRARLTSCP
ncbi:MAG: hypothetical protein NZ703_06830 [Gemmataceae bacterium]|nr:hypothetical protein [Gemmataceae bacterium]MCS7270782.1 hypothetical protein [Gemmataceae bacterium]MDW8242174.1 hypothetical protein [Thermogemmata sp.]